MKDYLANNGVALSRLLNTLLGGDKDATLSGRMGEAIRENRCFVCKPICWVLNWFDPGHCAKVDAAEPDADGE